MTLIHKTSYAIPYIGSKGRKVAWTEEYDREEVFIPKYRAPELHPSAPRSSKYAIMVLDAKRRIELGESLIRLDSDKPLRLASLLRRSAFSIAPELKFKANSEDKAVFVTKTEEK